MNFPVAGLARDGWSTESEATATCFCGSVQLVLVSGFPSPCASSLAWTGRTTNADNAREQPLQTPGLINRHVCHCADCRKISAAFYMSNIIVADTHLKHVRGQKNLTTFSEEETVRAKNAQMSNHFCATCGTLMYRTGVRWPGVSILRTGTVDDFSLAETKLRPQIEQFIENRVAWSTPIEGTVQTIGLHQPSDLEGVPREGVTFPASWRKA